MSDDVFVKSNQEWRDQLQTSLTQPFGWLSLAGLFWLEAGVNSCGTGAKQMMQLPDGSGAAHMADFELANGAVRFSLAEGLEGSVNDEPATSGVLASDHAERPSFLIVGDMRFLVIERGGQLALRVWWSQHPKRLNFAGRQWYPIDAKYKVRARIERYEPPKAVTVMDMLGHENPGQMDARLWFEVDGQAGGLDAQALDDGRFYIIFKDATAGKGTYPAARFLYSEAAEGETVMIDFNKAYSPPCAFTDFATCPLPIPENVLAVAIPAGEQYHEGAHA
jgi:hypothetical protein